ncbi:protein tyrosine kinase [Opisthorchis viverrini]|uniref:Protein tyrosine kinase n=1 Tax=Opisthorchis viverrini TaxID=6198 RepID=A0A1S8X6G0_OPIVI|nr:protein tyrosine kinase [Opisthorchis viverrini]
MLSGTTSPFSLSKELQSLISATLDNVILPLRKELKQSPQYADILSLEIQDAENKTYEYIAQQISAICNAEEETAHKILKEFPKSETCFKCLGINDDTIQGLLRIRGLGFLHILEMPDVEVSTILQNYGDSREEIDHILAGLTKIRSNIDLIENDLAFEDDTRNLIKLVIRLTKEDIDGSLSSLIGLPQGDRVFDGPIPPLYVTGPDVSGVKKGKQPVLSSPLNCPSAQLFNGVSDSEPCDSSRDLDELGVNEPNVALHTRPFSITPKDRDRRSPARTDVIPCVVGSAPTTSSCLTQLPSINGFRTFHPITSPTRSNFPWDGDVQIIDDGLSVPNTPIWMGKPTCSVTISPPFVNKSDRSKHTPDYTPPPSPRGRRYHANTVTYRARDHRQAGTPPPKHRLKLLFPLHRSKSHESNLANRVTPTTSSSILISRELGSRPSLTGANMLSPDSAIVAGDAFLYQDITVLSPTSSHGRSVSSSQHSPRSQGRMSYQGTCPSVAKPDASSTRNTPTSAVRSFESFRRVSCDARPPKPGIQPPTLMTTSVDGENVIGVLNLPGSFNGVTLVVSINGLVHKFETESRFGNFVRGTPCAVCSNRMSFRFQHCVHCRIKVHRGCVAQCYRLQCVPETSDSKSSPNSNRKAQVNVPAGLCGQPGLRPTHSTPAFQGSESNSASSCTSSAPGSPFGVGPSVCSSHLSPCQGTETATVVVSHSSPPYATVGHCTSLLNTSLLSSPVGAHSYATPAASSLGHSHSPHHIGHFSNHFEFPVPSHLAKDGAQSDHTCTTNNARDIQLISTQSSAESERTVVDGLVHTLESMESQDETGNLVRTNSISVTLKEWDIPMESLVIGDEIGRGTFGTVYRAKWHGEVAVKRIDIDPEEVDAAARLESFKREVALLHKTRHENLVLFMGACMKPPNLAIVTQLSQGETLYDELHHRGSSMAINRIINIATQVAKGMGYLHRKGIVHRDLKTRNIFVEANARVVIGDFGVFNSMQLYKKARWGNYLNVPPFWLCYVAPEVIQSLNLNCTSSTVYAELPMTFSSDVFAFGTVWYELLAKEYPFRGYPAETIVYLCARGIKQNLRIPGPKDFKEILVQCWAHDPSRRPEFTTLVKLLDRLPKLHRSPSYPTKPTSICLSSGSHGSLIP